MIIKRINILLFIVTIICITILSGCCCCIGSQTYEPTTNPVNSPTQTPTPTITPTATTTEKDPIIGRWGNDSFTPHMSYEFKSDNTLIIYEDGVDSTTVYSEKILYYWKKIDTYNYEIRFINGNIDANLGYIRLNENKNQYIFYMVNINNGGLYEREDNIPLSTFKVTSTPNPTPISNPIPSGYTIYDPDDYDYISWQYAISGFTKDWYNHDYVEMSENTLPSWRNIVRVKPEEIMNTMFGFKDLKGVKVVSANNVDIRTVIVTVETVYYDIYDKADMKQTVTVTLKRETIWGKSSDTSRFYVDASNFRWEDAQRTNL